MTSNEIKTEFLRFFEERGHKIVPSSSLIPDDPTMLLTTAGMVQFKPYFLNVRTPSYTRAASVQKCVRTTDIDLVGHTARHLTFFEMLGNFSFGDYYKAEVIPWAWQFITEVLKIDPNKLWISVFLDDDEAFDIWQRKVGISSPRIVRLGEEHNFWAAGPTGPCGPCSEIHYDFGEDKKCSPACEVGCDCDRFLEIWNLVFMQFDRDDKGALSPLPRKNIDTGIGVERTALVLQNAVTAFGTDHLRPIISRLEDISGARYDNSPTSDISMRVIADHCRAITFMVSDGIMPGNEGRGYVLRRLLRRAARHGKVLGIDEDFLNLIIDETIRQMAPTYPELNENSAFIKKIVETEEQRFSATLRQGMAILAEQCTNAIKRGEPLISGETAFRLYDTFGFPFEITKEIAAEQGLNVDEAGFDDLMSEQKSRAKEHTAFIEAHGEIGKRTVFDDLRSRLPQTEFEGYGSVVLDSIISALIKDNIEADEIAEGQNGAVILDKTVFYAEQGGQTGDVGVIESGTGFFTVEATTVEHGLIVHHGYVLKGKLKSGEKVTAKVDATVRAATTRNHTATHLLHWALRRVLGEHVKQGGSLVEPHRLRFDFTHYQSLSSEELAKVEALVNEKIIAADPVRCYTTSLDHAKSIGAMAIFGEKYGDFVRVVESGDFSKELCGGTHVTNTTDIHLFHITHEGSIGSNLRRIEAITGMVAIETLQSHSRMLLTIARHLNIQPENVMERIEKIEADAKHAQRSRDRSDNGMVENAEIEKIQQDLEQIGVFSVIAKVIPDKLEPQLKTMADALRDRFPTGIIVLGSQIDSTAFLVCACGPVAIKAGAHAGNLIKPIAAYVEGRGGGKDAFAQAGGSHPDGLVSAIQAVPVEVRKIIDASSRA